MEGWTITVESEFKAWHSGVDHDKNFTSCTVRCITRVTGVDKGDGSPVVTEWPEPVVVHYPPIAQEFSEGKDALKLAQAAEYDVHAESNKVTVYVLGSPKVGKTCMAARLAMSYGDSAMSNLLPKGDEEVEELLEEYEATMYFVVNMQAFICAYNTSSRGLGYGSQAWETTKSGEIMMNLTDTSGADVDLDKIKKNESKNYDGKEEDFGMILLAFNCADEGSISSLDKYANAIPEGAWSIMVGCQADAVDDAERKRIAGLAKEAAKKYNSCAVVLTSAMHVEADVANSGIDVLRNILTTLCFMRDAKVEKPDWV